MEQSAMWSVATAGKMLATMVVIATVAPLLEGTIRKLRAIVHSRKGPPLIQPYLDLAKLLVKEDLRVSPSLLLAVCPTLLTASTLLAGSLVPLWPGLEPVAPGDVVVFAYLIALSAACIILIGMASRSPYSVIGASREMIMVAGAEPVMVLCLLVGAVETGSLRFAEIIHFQTTAGPTLALVIAAVAYLLALQAQVAKIPFDIAEAETEIMDGPFTELSGPQLALCKLAMFSRQFIFCLLFVQIFIPWLTFGLPVAWLGTLVALVLVFLIDFGLVGLMDAVNPRLRVDQGVKYLGAIAVVAAVAIAYAALG